MIYFLCITLFNQVASSFCKKVADLYEQSSRRISSAVGAYWNPWKWYWNLSELYECKHICHRDRFIFYNTLWVFHNANKSKLLTLTKKEFICSTVLQTVFVLFASQLTAALPFSMRASSHSYLSQEPSTLSSQLLPVRLANITNALS